MNKEKKGAEEKKPIMSSIIIAVAVILLGFLLIRNASVDNKKLASDNNSGASNAPTVNNIKTITVDDHIRGNVDAPIKIIEFSDTECPFCKVFHLTMRQAVGEYSNQVVWAYRHFPLEAIHPKARKEAEALECAAELGGKEMFWIYLDKLFEVTPSNNQLELEKLNEIAEEVGLDKEKFKICHTSGKYALRVGENIREGLNIGITGTPYTVIITPNGKKIEIRGAQPYKEVKAAIEAALKEK